MLSRSTGGPGRESNEVARNVVTFRSLNDYNINKNCLLVLLLGFSARAGVSDVVKFNIIVYVAQEVPDVSQQRLLRNDV